MAISVVCSTCQARFKVSDKFAGQTGPCPKCKNPIKIPKASSDVTIHDPTEATASPNVGHMPTSPIVFKQESFSRVALTLVFSAVVSFDLDWSVAVSHYSLYVVLIALVRYISGLQPPL
jgi:hypothetical protein